VAEKRTRRGKPFWGCTRYPDCDWSIWDRPVPVAVSDLRCAVLVAKSTKARGEFYKCLECKSEMAPDSVETGAAK
jgi:DNA topoisomerase I